MLIYYFSTVTENINFLLPSNHLLNMVPKKLQLTTAVTDNFIDDVTHYRPRNISCEGKNSHQNEQSVCRICLDECPNTPFCLCKGSSMIHQRCLKLFILKGQGNFTSRSHCQICKHPFRVVANRKCLFSCSNGLQQIKQHLTASILYLVYTILTFVYIGYCSHLNSLGSLDSNLQLILLIVGICLSIAMLVIGLKWMISNLWVKVVILQKVLPLERIVRSLSICPIREEGPINETMEAMQGA